VVARPLLAQALVACIVVLETVAAQSVDASNSTSNCTAAGADDHASERRAYLIATTCIIGAYVIIAAGIATLVTLKVRS
jgi:TPP-dependent pyruvate/acetoin dehydrogenase alpha subunit